MLYCGSCIRQPKWCIPGPRRILLATYTTFLVPTGALVGPTLPDLAVHHVGRYPNLQPRWI